jgi:adenylate cyclase
MWSLTIRSAGGEPIEYTVTPGRHTIGRSPDNNISLSEASASRTHAELQYHPAVNALFLRDLESTNGTYVNRERVSGIYSLQSGDTFRIGEHVFSVIDNAPEKNQQLPAGRMNTKQLDRDFVLEALDHHAVLLFKVAQELNTVWDLDTALKDVAESLRTALGADRCQVILSYQFDSLAELGFPTSIALLSIDQRQAIIVPQMPADAEQRFGRSAFLLKVRSIMCVPIVSGSDMLGLIYTYKTDPAARPFNDTDMQLAVAISHQAALTIQRMLLLERFQKEQEARNLLQRFLSPPEAETLLNDYMRSGALPGLVEQRLTVLVIDIVDSTGLAERIGAQSFGRLLSQWYEQMTEIIFQNVGVLDKYIGDGLMAVFGSNGARLNPEADAVRAGLQIIERLNRMNETTVEPIAVGIAVNSGMVVAGYVGTRERVEFTVLGDAVNIAFRLEPMARPNRLVIGAGTAAAVAGLFDMQRVGAVELRGRSKPVQAYEVLRARALSEESDDVGTDELGKAVA